MIDFVIVNYKSVRFIKLLTNSIKRFVLCDYNVVIVDNSNDLSELNAIFKDQSGIHIEPGNYKGSLGSESHSNGVNQAFQFCKNEYVCILDPDTVFVREWVKDLKELADKYAFVSGRYEESLGIARPQFMFMRRSFLTDNNLVFSHEHQDTGGNLTKFCEDNGLEFLILPNSRNNKEMEEKHVFPEVYCEQSFINDDPFFLHQGRGGLKGDRSKWFSVLEGYING